MPDGRSKYADLVEGLFQRMANGMCVLDRRLRCVEANAAFAAIVQEPLDELIGRPADGLFRESAGEEFAVNAQRVLFRGEPVVGVEISADAVPGTDPDRAWIMSLDALRLGGELWGVVASFQEVTQIRRAERVARQQLEELESVYRNAPVGISFTDRDLRYLRVNQVIADMNGVSVGEMIGRTYREMSPETADAAEPFLRRNIEKGRSIKNVEVRSTPPSDPGVEHVYLLSLEPVRDGDDQVIGQVSAVQDVTDLRRAEETSSRRLQELEFLYAHAPVKLVHVDTDLRIVQANGRFARLSGRPEAQLAGTRLFDAMPEEIAAQIAPRLRAVSMSGEPQQAVLVRGPLLVDGGTEHTWSVTFHPVKSREGEVTGIVGLWQDVTGIAKRQRAISDARDRLAEAQSVALIGSWEWNLIEDKLWWSPELYEIFGEDLPYEPSYDDFFDHVHPEDRQKVRLQLDRTMADVAPHRMTYRIVRSDGTERILFATAQVERTIDGAPARLVGTCQDVTERSARPRIDRRYQR